MKQAGSPQVEISGKGFTTELLDHLIIQPEVVHALAQNGQLQITLKPETKISNIVTLLVAKGAQVDGMHQGKATLEDVFLTLMEEGK